MVENSFPRMQTTDIVGKRHKPGFTDGKTIWTNLYTGILMEEYIEEDLNILYVHELIHTIDMDLSEREVLKMTDVVLKSLRQQSKEK